jgi:hypothetical protein
VILPISTLDQLGLQANTTMSNSLFCLLKKAPDAHSIYVIILILNNHVRRNLGISERMWEIIITLIIQVNSDHTAHRKKVALIAKSIIDTNTQ